MAVSQLRNANQFVSCKGVRADGNADFVVALRSTRAFPRMEGPWHRRRHCCCVHSYRQSPEFCEHAPRSVLAFRRR